MGVVFLENETRELEVGGEKILISGLLPPYQYYKKGGKDFLKSEEIEVLLGKTSKISFRYFWRIPQSMETAIWNGAVM